MWTRRAALIGSAMTLIPGPVGSRPQASRHNPIYGCTLPDTETGDFFGTATESRLYVSGEEPMIDDSGDPDFDFALAHTLAKISAILDVAPGFAYYDDYDVKNAYATRAARSYGVDGTVL